MTELDPLAELNSEDRRAVEEGAREAASHVLALLDEQETPHEFIRHLLDASPTKQAVIVSALAKGLIRHAVESADMATFKLKLRLMANEPMPDEG
jgi:hypothetical protein